MYSIILRKLVSPAGGVERGGGWWHAFAIVSHNVDILLSLEEGGCPEAGRQGVFSDPCVRVMCIGEQMIYQDSVWNFPGYGTGGRRPLITMLC